MESFNAIIDFFFEMVSDFASLFTQYWIFSVIIAIFIIKRVVSYFKLLL